MDKHQIAFSQSEYKTLIKLYVYYIAQSITRIFGAQYFELKDKVHKAIASLKLE